MPAQVVQLQLPNPADQNPSSAALDASSLQQASGPSEQGHSAQQQPALNILPYGTTLHYPGCTCPSSWQPGSRVADQVDRLVAKAHGLYQQGLIAPQRQLRVCYMLPHHNITGGMKCLVEHIRLLRARGHYTIAVHRCGTGSVGSCIIKQQPARTR